jgi:septal ring factor EnvC (AmiA/AmiB activator)
MLACASAQAQPVTYKCVDNAGRSTYTNVKEEMTGKKCVAVSREVSVVPAQPPASRAAAPAASNNARASDRRKILEEELGSEQKRLAEAKERLAEQQSIRNGDERNYQRVLDRLKPYVDAVEQHEKNISQLRRELSGIR